MTATPSSREASPTVWAMLTFGKAPHKHEPDSWQDHLLHPTGGYYWQAGKILAEICYRYRPIHLHHQSENGNGAGLHAEQVFADEYPAFSYRGLHKVVRPRDENQQPLPYGKRSQQIIYRALHFLENAGVITRHTQDVMVLHKSETDPNGSLLTLRNHMYIELHLERLVEITEGFVPYRREEGSFPHEDTVSSWEEDTVSSPVRNDTSLLSRSPERSENQNHLPPHPPFQGGAVGGSVGFSSLPSQEQEVEEKEAQEAETAAPAAPLAEDPVATRNLAVLAHSRLQIANLNGLRDVMGRYTLEQVAQVVMEAIKRDELKTIDDIGGWIFNAFTRPQPFYFKPLTQGHRHHALFAELFPELASSPPVPPSPPFSDNDNDDDKVDFYHGQACATERPGNDFSDDDEASDQLADAGPALPLQSSLPPRFTAPPDPNQRVWQEVLTELSYQMPAASFQILVQDTELLEVIRGDDGQTWVLRPPNQMALAWMSERLAPIIIRTLVSMTRQPAALRFESKEAVGAAA